MVSPELLENLEQLSHTDKILVIQYLVGQVAREAGTVIDFDTTYEVWSPQITSEGLDVLNKLLGDSEDNP